MISGTCIEIQSDIFPIMPGEDEEIVNAGMYGKALCVYLEKELPSFGLAVDFYCAEDWGWWIEISEKEFTLPLLVYTFEPIGNIPQKYYLQSSITDPKRWSWKKFKTIDISKNIISIIDKIENALLYDDEIYVVERYDEFPE